MNTTKKGDAFENRVYKAISEELKNERLGILPNSSQVFQKKEYFSRDRNANIIVDISIEVRLPNANNWSFLWVWECKDYKSSIPVDNVEEFHSKISQIAGDNVKGTFVISGALQSSALSYAKSKGIGVIRVLPDDQVHWVMYNLTAELIEKQNRLNRSEFWKALTTHNFESFNRDFYATDNEYIFGDWFSVITHTINNHFNK